VAIDNECDEPLNVRDPV